MGYIGRSIEYGNAVVDHFVGNGGATYTLNYDTNTDGVVISLDGVVQKNGTDFNITGTSLVFTSVVASPIEIQVVYTGLTLSFPTPSDGSVTDAKIVDMAASKLTGTIADARFPATLPAISGANLTNLPSDITKGTAEPTATTPSGSVIGDVYLRTTTGEMYCCTATSPAFVWTNIGSGTGDQPPIYSTATGGTITTNGNFKIHTFVSSGTFQVTRLGDSPLFNILTIAGGGAGSGGEGGGGAGAGGFKFFKDRTLAATSYTITIGGGGASASANVGGASGSNSSFASLVATGGGGTGAHSFSGLTGGSGGGGSGRNSTSGGSGTTNQGNNGGNATSSSGSSDDAGGGGGGSKTAGGNGSSTTPGNGGAGYQEGTDSPYDWEANDGSTASFEINGTGNSYAGGGAGGSEAGSSGTGGSGGGGNSETAGTANTGGGGGGNHGTASPSGAGGSGVVIIRYQFQ